MNSKYISTIRWRFIYAFVLSALSGGLLLFAGYQLVNSMIYLNKAPASAPYSRMLRWIINHIGSTPLMTAAGIISFLLFFFIYTRKIILYVEEITRGIQEMTNDGMSHRIEVRTGDELGVLAENINRMAEQLQHSILEERKAVSAKNDLIAGVSHDLRTPLTSVLGFLEYIEQDRCREEAEIRYYVGIAYGKALVLRKLIDDLFEYTRLSSGELPLQLERLDLKAFIRQVLDESVPALMEAEMTYEIQAEPEPVWIEASPVELVRAYDNLIMNAIRYGKDGGRLEIGIDCSGEEVRVRVSNFGEMIAQHDLPYIFERFYRADKSRSRHSGGSGLGLAIARSIISRHHGRIYAESTPERTDFITCFPVLSKS